MRPGHEILMLLRQKTRTAMLGWGFVVRGANLHFSGRCTVRCARHTKPGMGLNPAHSSVYELNVTQGGLDWYYPYQANQALSCLVPFGQPNGTLVLTFGMNGCALEVREELGGNRFFHDADGINMPMGGGGKFRAEYATYAGPDDTTRVRAERSITDNNNTAGNFEHCLVCVKENDNWHVYSTGVITMSNLNTMTFHAWQVKDRVPCYLGSFADSAHGAVLSVIERQARRDWGRNRKPFKNNESPI